MGSSWSEEQAASSSSLVRWGPGLLPTLPTLLATELPAVVALLLVSLTVALLCRGWGGKKGRGVS